MEEIRFLEKDMEALTFKKIDEGEQRTDFVIKPYNPETDLTLVMGLIDNELSEPYSILTYRYFLDQWPELCFVSWKDGHCFGCVVSKKELHKSGKNRGYIAMVVVKDEFRGHGIGRKLVQKCVDALIEAKVDEITLEAEVTNKAALALYEGLGFIREKRLNQYYMCGTDAYRLKMELYHEDEEVAEEEEEIIIAEIPAISELNESNIEETDEEKSQKFLSIQFRP